jgi:hypothetical protein
MIQLLQTFGPKLKDQLVLRNAGVEESRDPVIPFPTFPDPLPLGNASLPFANALLAGVLSYT